jgi:DNA repair exonuclease SbcCD ATPase subunit
MKKYIFPAILFFTSFLFADQIFAQQDYQIVQNFKNKQQQIEDSIQTADSLSQLENLSAEIEKLKENYSQYKTLLDKSLYPEDFNSTINRLNNRLDLRKGDFTQINVLQTQVTELKDQFDQLNQRNNELINQVTQLTEQSKKDKQKIAQLERSISELKNSLQKRDELVMTMVDSLIPASSRVSNLSPEQKQKVITESKKVNLVSNILKSIEDNIRFIEITKLNPDDVDQMKKQQQDFARMWRNAGPKIIDIYSQRGQNINQLKAVDSAFTAWHNVINQEPWNSIREDYSKYNINLPRFNSGKQFTETMTSYVDDQIKNIEMKGKEESEQEYKYFVDSVWFSQIKPNWVPYLVDNKMITAAQKDTIENKFSQWNDEVHPSRLNWLYIIIGILIIVVVILLFTRRRPRAE